MIKIECELQMKLLIGALLAETVDLVSRRWSMTFFAAIRMDKVWLDIN